MSYLLSLTNIVLRAGALISRFAITLYIAKYLDLAAVGAYGLIYALTIIAPAALGFGLDFRVSREIVGMPEEAAALRVRDRLAVNATLYVSAALCALTAVQAGIFHPLPHLGVVLVIGLLESVAFDMHIFLISLRKSWFANLLLFFRIAWAIPFMAIGFVDHGFRDFFVLLLFWLGGLFVTFSVMFFGLRHWPWKQILSAPVDFPWLIAHLRRSRLIYVSDLSLTGTAFLDRFAVDFVLGLGETGVYIFFLNIANGLQQLVYAGVVQVAMPKLIEGARHADPSVLICIIRQEVLKVVAVYSVVAIAVYGCIQLILPHISRPALLLYPWLLPAMLVAMLIRSMSDVLNYGLFARNYDTSWALVNILAVLLTLVFVVASLKIWNLEAVGITLIVTQLLMLWLRVYAMTGKIEVTNRPPLGSHQL
ncbi:MAG: hypothetical protein WDN01_14645 [Rhizomicrobium sp.]